MTPLIWITALASAVLLHIAGFYIAQETHWLSLDSLARPTLVKNKHTNITVELNTSVKTAAIDNRTQETTRLLSKNTPQQNTSKTASQQQQNQTKTTANTNTVEKVAKEAEKTTNTNKPPEANIADALTTDKPLLPSPTEPSPSELSKPLEEKEERIEKREEALEPAEALLNKIPITSVISDELDELTTLVPPNTATEAPHDINTKRLSDTFNIIGQEQNNKTLDNTTQGSSALDSSNLGNAKDMFNRVFSPTTKHALEQAVQDQKDYLAGRISSTPYPITKDADGTRYVDIKGVCWKMPPEGESGEWFIVYSGCSGQKKSFHIEFGITPDMFGSESPLTQGLLK